MHHTTPHTPAAIAGTNQPAASAAATPACGSCQPCAHAHHTNHHHEPDDDHAGHGHDHSSLPSWPRIALALLLAAGAEAAHWGQAGHAPQATPLLQFSVASGWPIFSLSALQLVGMALALAAIALTGLGVYRSGLRDVRHLRLGIHALMAVAVTGAFAIGQWPEAAMVMALYMAAERLEDGAVHRAQRAIGSLLTLAPDTAELLLPNGQTETTAVQHILPGALVQVAAGARVPLDGTVEQGHSAVNQSPITGESQWMDKTTGDQVYAGSINQHGTLSVRVGASAQNSVLARIVQTVAQAQKNRAPTQRWVDRFARVYTPLVMVLALLLALAAPLLWGWPWHDALYQALALLVIACPCALVIATPVTVVSALTAAARHGILIKGGSALEQARQLRTLALDKTGTLTTGQPKLMHWANLPQATDATNHPPFQLAQALASRSDHPVSQAIATGLALAVGDSHNATTTPSADLLNAVNTVHTLPGRGLHAELDGQRYWLGNLRLMHENGLHPDANLAAHWHKLEQQGHSISVLANAQALLAWFAVADPLRPEARQAIAQLHAQGVRTLVLSGDNPATVASVATQAGIQQAQGGLLPQDKLNALATLQQQNGPVAMVGDGINDAPALAQANLGFAMGGIHSSDLAMESADVVLMHDDLRRLPDTLALSQHSHRVMWQNIGLALFVKTVFFALAVLGQASMWLAVLADMGVSLLVVANGLRLRRWQPQYPGLK